MSQAVHDMFDSIAHRYDLVNDVLSGGIHRCWRRTLLRRSAVAKGDTVLDLCTGTGEVARAAARISGSSGRVTAVDFVEQMLELARAKPAEKGAAPINYTRCDATLLPFRESSFQRVLIAYGIRNVDSPRNCLREIKRVLTPGGRLGVLECGQVRSRVLGAAFGFYSRQIMPRIGQLLSGNRAAYEYLPRTSAAFPSGERFIKIMEEAGFENCQATPLFDGVAYVYTGDRPLN